MFDHRPSLLLRQNNNIKRKVLFASGLFLIVLVLLSTTIQAPPNAAVAGAYYPFKIDGPNSVVGFNYWKMMWHYDDAKTEKQNLKAFQTWWCIDSKGSMLKNCNNKEAEPVVRDMKGLMLFVKEHTLQIISIKVTEF
ncbi:hypothetical protein NTE_00506 [Candidatus Nitrososphaera evergladensis SR1]|uniref:Uncharacterized protein n=2 Tax=Nitrososphaera TaxID=497726 RepID=A0A075MP66_9ARCH|nr:hypothetical protein NTE_00506 [Candidatus Nitrososphaera evergladensis SR1]